MKKAQHTPWHFAGIFLLVFFLSSVLLYVIDFVPEAPSPKESGTVAGVASQGDEHFAIELPSRISIPAIGVNTPIGNPTSTDVADLDQALLQGAVRYPSSAKLGEEGTVYLFGHQSYLPVVHNQAFKAFNDLQKLKEGDQIVVTGASAEYTYAVRSVTLTTAEDGVIPLSTDGHTLMLSTCNSFGKDHEQRYIVAADFISRTALPSTTN